jgi:PhnB protein
VPDADTVFARALAGGATPAMPVTAQDDGSRMGGFVNPFGTLWWVSTTDPAGGAAA